jgi:FAD/FMN-containing dehydrogenase
MPEPLAESRARPDRDIRPAASVRDGTIAGWGRLGVTGREVRSENLERVTRGAVLSRGLGRSYGDSSLPPPGVSEVVSTVLADRILDFDPSTGLLRAEAGTSLRALNRLFIRRGFFVPVTPGTQFVTLGGMVASDVHGKDHHSHGCFGEHVKALRMRVADGRIVTASEAENADLFRATIGGMGLTGHILEVTFPMRPIPSPWIRTESRRVGDIDAFLGALQDGAARWPYTVGWIDCLTRGKHMGRGMLMAGDWADPSDAPRHFPEPRPAVTLPFDLPEWALGRLSVQAFNAALFAQHGPKVKERIQHWEDFFYPLDMIRDWNRMYGTRGLTQYQCVLPDSAGRDAARRVLEILTRHGGASFLCVIKDCGPEGKGMLSFPTAGISIALDIPVRDGTQALVDALNEQVLREGGRIYLTKDQFTRGEHFRAMETRLPAFLEVRRKWDPELRIRSAQSVRLFGA